ncbi:MAG: NUDIX hydrolase [Candidatus Odinarchaeia archaeon]
MSRIYPTAPIVGVGAILLEGDSILLIKRAQEPGRGRWSIPGGLVKIGESVKDAIKREMLEETNLTIKVGALADVFDYIQRDASGKIKFHYVIVDFFVEEYEGVAKPLSDAVDLKWIKLDDTYKLPLTSTTRTLIRRLEKKLKN